MRNKYGEIVFEDYPEFRPNLTPREIFKMGSFGGTYWRPIHSAITGKNHRRAHLKYRSWWVGIPNDHMVRSYDQYDKKINKYGVRVGTDLEYWEDKHWIVKSHPYGWVQWYCDFYSGKRCADDERQIGRWLRTAGPNSRFRKHLIRLCFDATHGKSENMARAVANHKISPKIRQTLQHWAYTLNVRDCKQALKNKWF